MHLNTVIETAGWWTYLIVGLIGAVVLAAAITPILVTSRIRARRRGRATGSTVVASGGPRYRAPRNDAVNPTCVRRS